MPNSMALYSLIYVSNPIAPQSAADLERLADEAQSNNARLGVTGLLLYSGEHFCQVLEGDYPVLADLFARIEKDPRHGHVEVLLGTPIRLLFFPDWAMGVVDVSKSRHFDRAALRAICDRAEGQPQPADRAALDMLYAFRSSPLRPRGVTRAA